METGEWVALFSGGKDSSWAFHDARRRNVPVGRLVTMVPDEDAWLFHVPGTDWAEVLAARIGLPLTRARLEPIPDPVPQDASSAGDHEAAQLVEVISTIDRTSENGLDGIVSGAVASEFQYDRLERLTDALGIEHLAPLWQVEPGVAARRMIDDGFDIRIVAVAAEGLDQTWLGRRYDEDTVTELEVLAERYGVHVLGEGGEFETFVVDGPHMDGPIRVEATPRWDGTRGHLELEDVRRANAPAMVVTDRS